ncbi:MAG: HipA domain-containing protein [Actinobacteria bacterium]|nr:HipA domain-containing protein [Actinomycetota bacterium]
MIDVSSWPEQPKVGVDFAGRGRKIVVADPAGALHIVKRPRGGDVQVYTELVATRLGGRIGLPVPDCFVGTRSEETVLVSRSFVGASEQLIHGKKLFIRAWPDVDRDLDRLEYRQIHTVENVVAAFRWSYTVDASALLCDFALLLGFDAWIGNSDRHWENYGVLEDVLRPQDEGANRLAPAFDNASCLFWNVPDDDLPSTPEALAAYRRRARADMCVLAGRTPRHVELLRNVVEVVPGARDSLHRLLERMDGCRGVVERLVVEEAGACFSVRRMRAVKEYLMLADRELRGVT